MSSVQPAPRLSEIEYLAPWSSMQRSTGPSALHIPEGMITLRSAAFILLFASVSVHVLAQSYGQPDRNHPGDTNIQKYLQAETRTIEADFLPGITTAEDWHRARPSY